METIGITGGIGSGKSTVLGIMKDSFSAYIAEADRIAHELMKPGNRSYDMIVETFGDPKGKDEAEFADLVKTLEQMEG